MLDIFVGLLVDGHNVWAVIVNGFDMGDLRLAVHDDYLNLQTTTKKNRKEGDTLELIICIPWWGKTLFTLGSGSRHDNEWCGRFAQGLAYRQRDMAHFMTLSDVICRSLGIEACGAPYQVKIGALWYRGGAGRSI